MIQQFVVCQEAPEFSSQLLQLVDTWVMKSSQICSVHLGVPIELAKVSVDKCRIEVGYQASCEFDGQSTPLTVVIV
jgi:hypothetical protein